MSHPSDTPRSSHVESRSRKALRSYIIQAATLLEIVMSGLQEVLNSGTQSLLRS